MDKRFDSYCGLYCGACGILIANEKDNLKELAHKCNCTEEELHCSGCKTEINSKYCRKCTIKSCAIQKRVEFCFECEEYPCNLILEFAHDESPHHSVVLNNLKDISTQGIEIWLQSQKIRWSCESCGERFSWYDEMCDKCGSKLYNCIEEENKIKAVLD